MAFLKYTLMRLVLLVVTAVPLYLVGLRGLFLGVVAIFVSGFLSIVLLSGTRGQASEALDSRLTKIRTKLDSATTAEDEWDDAQRRDPDAPPAKGDHTPS